MMDGSFPSKTDPLSNITTLQVIKLNKQNKNRINL